MSDILTKSYIESTPFQWITPLIFFEIGLFLPAEYFINQKCAARF